MRHLKPQSKPALWTSSAEPASHKVFITTNMTKTCKHVESLSTLVCRNLGFQFGHAASHLSRELDPGCLFESYRPVLVQSSHVVPLAGAQAIYADSI